MTHNLITLFLINLALALGVSVQASAADKPKESPNILFISVDDLRPELNCYGNPIVKSPNMDRLAEAGLLFERAYCQRAICMPSRVSVLSGYRPESFDFSWKFSDERMPSGTVSMPQFFKGNGYTTISIGKIYHANDDDPEGWTKRYEDSFYEGHGYCSGYQLKSNKDTVHTYLYKRENELTDDVPRPNSCEIADVPDETYTDGIIAAQSIEALNELKQSDKPFFLAVGFYRPHLPFAAPKKYWDLYKRDEIPLPANPQDVVNGVTRSEWEELRRYGDIPGSGPVSDDKARELIHGYYASVSFTDAQVGKVIAELERLELDRNTVVVLWGDHGWNLGEHGWWSKHTNYEVSTRAAMMVSVPWMPQGNKTRALVELIDIYPSLCELASIEPPSHLEGASFVPLFEDPSRPWKTAAFSDFGGARTVRTDRYRLIEHKAGGLELFDHQNDPGENFNIAGDPENAATIADLTAQLNADRSAMKPIVSDEN